MFTKAPLTSIPNQLPLLDRLAMALFRELKDQWAKPRDALDLLEEYKKYRKENIDDKLRDFFGPRITGETQLIRVKKALSDGEWKTLKRIAEDTGDPQASVSARIRDLRKDEYGNYLILTRCLNGKFDYKMDLSNSEKR